MRQQKLHKKETKPKRRDIVEDSFYHGKPSNEKVKYKHMTFWLDQEEEVPSFKKKKKVKS